MVFVKKLITSSSTKCMCQKFLLKQSRLLSTGSTFQNQNRNYWDKSEGRQNKRYAVAAALLGAGLVSTATYKRLQALSHQRQDNNKPQSKESIYSRKDVAKHDSLERGVWITYRGNVYDITDFIRHHPGGSHTIMMGAGGDVEPFWQTYTVHNASEVQNLLSQYKIGVLSPEEQATTQLAASSDDSPYANDPQRNPLLQVLTAQPFNAETPGKLLMPTYITPTDIFFVRNHLPVPEVDVADYRLAVCVGTDGDQESLKVIAEFTLDEIKKKFKPYTVDSVVQCSGNRRVDLKSIKEIKGLGWKVGAIGNARWTGARLVDVLDSLGIKADESTKHVQLEGLDCDMTGQSYGASISADVALDPNKHVILAYEMNGQPLTRDHGFPLRFVAPGVTGARNVKWLGKIILSHEESNSHWQRKDYKSFSPNINMFNLNFDTSASIQETPVQSAICDPADGDILTLSVDKTDPKTPITVPVRGYAYSGGGKMIIRVDVSIDGGSTWMTAKLDDVPKTGEGMPDYSNRNQVFAWTRWSIDVPIPANLLEKKTPGSMEILCRAFDSSYNSQPERPETVWNVRGVVNNSWHRIKLKLKAA